MANEKKVYVDATVLEQLNKAFLSGIKKYDRTMVMQYLRDNGSDEAYRWIEENNMDYWNGVSGKFVLFDYSEMPNIQGRYVSKEVLCFAKEQIDKCSNPEYKKIPEICMKADLCVRNHLGYANYQIKDRSNCPQICPLYK